MSGKICASVLAAAALALAGCTSPGVPAGTATVTDAWARAGGVWSSGGHLLVAAGVREDQGRVALCGAWTTTPQSVLSVRHNETVIEAGSARFRGVRLAQGLGFMARLPEGAPLAGATARCVRTEEPWQPGDEARAVTVRLPHMAFEYDEYMGPLAVFRQTALRTR